MMLIVFFETVHIYIENGLNPRLPVLNRNCHAKNDIMAGVGKCILDYAPEYNRYHTGRACSFFLSFIFATQKYFFLILKLFHRKNNGFDT